MKIYDEIKNEINSKISDLSVCPKKGKEEQIKPIVEPTGVA